MEHFERVLPKSQAEVSVVEQRLIRAGYRKDTAVKVFYGTKVAMPSRMIGLDTGRAPAGSIRSASATAHAVRNSQTPRIRQTACQSISLRLRADRNVPTAAAALRVAPMTTSQGVAAINRGRSLG